MNIKLLKIKKWIGLEEAAERLSSITEESISVLDLIELGLSGDLTLSVRLPYGEKFVGREMVYETVPVAVHLLDMFMFRKISIEGLGSSSGNEDAYKVDEEEFEAYLQEDFENFRRNLSRKYGKADEFSLETYLNTCTYGKYKYVTEPHYLDEVIYDLPMVGAEVLDLERIYSAKRGYESKELINLDGAFIKGRDGRLFNLMDAFEVKKHGSRIFDLESENYYPAGGLPVNSEIGMRPENLIAFEKAITGSPELGEMDFSLLVGSLLSVLKNTNSLQRRWTQDSLKEELVEVCPQFTRRALDDYFAEANKRFKEKIN
ncbi:hypothetical protein [Citrobacter portucalensis]|uniref:hypothetical protein n=1 Tax=Citrobacter portucalensis TaxID=1639133 RepID=UPI00226B5E48|nr:hypothetical protein [Citrobacter portucalensis]MCX9070634.1 hypothetical protein [Citrobacter portucalensis]